MAKYSCIGKSQLEHRDLIAISSHFDQNGRAVAEGRRAVEAIEDCVEVRLRGRHGRGAERGDRRVLIGVRSDGTSHALGLKSDVPGDVATIHAGAERIDEAEASEIGR